MSDRELIDDDGENRAVRTFLQLYGGTNSVEVGRMREHMRLSGWDGLWPDWIGEAHPCQHLTKNGAQSWLRHLFGLEAAQSSEVAQSPEVSSGGTGVSSGDSAYPAQAADEENKIWNALAWMYRRLQNGYGRLPFVEEAMALAKVGQAAQPQDVKAIHSAVLALQCDLRLPVESRVAFLAGVHRAAAVVSQFAAPVAAQPQDAKLMPKEIPDAVREHSYYINGLFGSRQWDAIWELLPVATQPVQDNPQIQCRYPLCQSEAEQDRIAAEVHAELYSGEVQDKPQEAGHPKVERIDGERSRTTYKLCTCAGVQPAPPASADGLRVAYDALRFYVDASSAELAERGITRSDALRLARDAELVLSQRDTPAAANAGELHDCQRKCPPGYVQGDPNCRTCCETSDRLRAVYANLVVDSPTAANAGGQDGREEFERWMRSFDSDPDLSTYLDAPEDYCEWEVQRAWEAWKASRAMHTPTATSAAGRDAVLESAVQAVAERAGELERIAVVSAFDAIRSLKANRHALPEGVEQRNTPAAKGAGGQP